MIFRLETSFESESGYAELAELAIESLKEAASDAKREVEEYRVMVGTIRLMRYTIDRLAEVVSDADLPEDVATLLTLLTPRDRPQTASDLPNIMQSMHDAMEARDRIVEEQGDTDSSEAFEARRRRLEALVSRHLERSKKGTVRALPKTKK